MLAIKSVPTFISAELTLVTALTVSAARLVDIVMELPVIIHRDKVLPNTAPLVFDIGYIPVEFENTLPPRYVELLADNVATFADNPAVV